MKCICQVKRIVLYVLTLLWKLVFKVELQVGPEKTVQNCWCNSPTQTGMYIPDEVKEAEN